MLHKARVSIETAFGHGKKAVAVNSLSAHNHTTRCAGIKNEGALESPGNGLRCTCIELRPPTIPRGVASVVHAT